MYFDLMCVCVCVCVTDFKRVVSVSMLRVFCGCFAGGLRVFCGCFAEVYLVI